MSKDGQLKPEVRPKEPTTPPRISEPVKRPEPYGTVHLGEMEDPGGKQKRPVKRDKRK